MAPRNCEVREHDSAGNEVKLNLSEEEEEPQQVRAKVEDPEGLGSAPASTTAWRPTEPLFQKDRSADVILCSSDEFKFRVHKLVLSIASPVLRDSLTVQNGGIPDPLKLEETGEVLEKLLKLCYPVERPTWSSVSDVSSVLAAAVKYKMKGIIPSLRQELVLPRFLETEALHIFTIACRLGLNDEARIAVPYTLRGPVVSKPPIPELQSISGLTFHQLLEYREDCSKAAARLTRCPGQDRGLSVETGYGLPVLRKDVPRPTLRPTAQMWPVGGSLIWRALVLLYPQTLARVFQDLTAFSELLAAEVDKRVKKIADTYDFCA
ncbi:hypothetical protein GLOTRDRAFT_128065 [Gloeophyllum trabeum ATCC 11539]|uniref:BTB domain-containing protein n=1 Tax=Gloeophyllum trabeum (strain ATCC 11539 / FP-39264 / Madison 617) TaxID=670483 RepID=S7Q9B1_GLOTA|nr:uncharacterized protein GLOTRDRAFT_128065 [Gloeophyllum trabeum ATCC 11539]EPQ56107.1 hypothetical protein GLOTRDRAFT_128065 [Gloeophyllum trabeum ATCC 11539]